MKKITDEFVDSVNAELWQEGVDKYGSKFSLPKDVERDINETVRALYVLQVWQKNGSSGNPLSQLRTYSVSEDVAHTVVSQYLGDKYIKQLEKEKSEKTEKRKDKWDSFIEWANENEGKKFTTEQLEKKSGFSYQTTLNYVKTSPVFEKLKKGHYRVIPLADRVRKK